MSFVHANGILRINNSLDSVDTRLDPEEEASGVDGGKECGGVFGVAGGDAAPAFQV